MPVVVVANSDSVALARIIAVPGAWIHATSNWAVMPRILARRVVAIHSGSVVLVQTVSSEGTCEMELKSNVC